VQDVQFLPHLRGVYWARLYQAWKRKVEEETRVRVLLSQSATYESHGADKALGPWQALLPQRSIDDLLPFEDDYEDDFGDFPALWAEDDTDDDWLYPETAADFEFFGNPSPNSH
jgi:hypothetical protein